MHILLVTPNGSRTENMLRNAVNAAEMRHVTVYVVHGCLECDKPLDEDGIVFLDADFGPQECAGLVSYLRDVYPDAPVLLVARLKERNGLKAVVAAGAVGWIQKPMEPSKLMKQIVQAYVRQKRFSGIMPSVQKPVFPIEVFDERDMAVLRVKGTLSRETHASFQDALQHFLGVSQAKRVVDLLQYHDLSARFVPTLAILGDRARVQNRPLSVIVSPALAEQFRNDGLAEIFRLIVAVSHQEAKRHLEFSSGA